MTKTAGMRERAAATLARLRVAGLRHMTFRDLGIEFKEWPPSNDIVDQLEALDLYLARYVPTPDGACVGCGSHQGGDDVDALLGRARFTWGLAHGEGYCMDCGWPARAYHYDIPGGLFKQRVNWVMQYHPDALSTEPPSPVGQAQ